MFKKLSLKVRRIFIGRKNELEGFDEIWKQSGNGEENLVYVLLNAPGVGKTTLIQHFGRSLEDNSNGLYIRFICSSRHVSIAELNEEIIKKIEKVLHDNQGLIMEYINDKEKGRDTQWLERKLNELNQFLNAIKVKDAYLMKEPINLLSKIAEIIPVFFASDEVQEFQKISFTDSNGNEETGLHYFTRILKDLINDRIFILLSGTRYHILNQIGNKIGSPIREKAHPIVLGNFSVSEILEYVEEVKLLIKNQISALQDDLFIRIMAHYHQFLLGFSGGHPRTIERITIEFLNNLPFFLKEKQCEGYDAFMEYLLPLTLRSIQGSLMTTDKEDALLELRDHELFGRVKKWIIRKSHDGLLLGFPPGFGKIDIEAMEIQRIIYDLMNLGFIVQNGNSNYYLTSYYHLLAFIEPFQEEPEAFLKQVLHNKHFKLMCGSHSGFGYTFENVLSAAFLVKGMESSKELIIPIEFFKIRDIKVLKGNLNWEEITLEEDVLYQTPQARAIDALILQKGSLVLMQFTTANPPDPSKIKALNAEMENVNRLPVRGWFVSLFPIKALSDISDDLMITSGEDLNAILGVELTERLRDIKQSL